MLAPFLRTTIRTPFPFGLTILLMRLFPRRTPPLRLLTTTRTRLLLLPPLLPPDVDGVVESEPATGVDVSLSLGNKVVSSSSSSVGSSGRVSSAHSGSDSLAGSSQSMQPTGSPGVSQISALPIGTQAINSARITKLKVIVLTLILIQSNGEW